MHFLFDYICKALYNTKSFQSNRSKNTSRQANAYYLNMKVSSANNLPEEQGGSSQGSFIDTNSISGESDLDAASAAGDQNQIGELKKMIKGNHSQISELEGRLKVTEIQLECQKDKINLYEVIVKDKDDVIRVLQNSIDLITKTSELAIKQLQKPEAGIVTCNNANNLQKENDLLESIDEIKSKVKDNNVDNFGAQLQEFECQANEDSADSHEVDDNLEKFQEQLDKCKEENELLELKNSQQKLELDELKSKMIESQKIEDSLRKQVSELENNFLSVSAKLKESSEKLSEYSLNIDSSPDNQEIVPLNNTKNSKVKIIERDGMEPFMAVIEDIPSAGSGWIVIQRRIDVKSKFAAYGKDGIENGFGDINASFWLGLNLIHELTTSQRHELYIQVVDYDGVTAYARYDHFEVGSEEEQYKIKSLGSYSGNAGDALRSHENASIRFNNLGNGNYCFWWAATPTNCNLNGMYYRSDQYGFFWGRLSLGSKNCHLNSCQMLIRPRSK